jgi:hypothetical protein
VRRAALLILFLLAVTVFYGVLGSVLLDIDIDEALQVFNLLLALIGIALSLRDAPNPHRILWIVAAVSVASAVLLLNVQRDRLHAIASSDSAAKIEWNFRNAQRSQKKLADATASLTGITTGDLECPPYVVLLPFPTPWTWNVGNPSEKFPAFITGVSVRNDRTGMQYGLELYGEMVVAKNSGKSFGAPIPYPAGESFSASIFTRHGLYSQKIRIPSADGKIRGETTLEKDGQRLDFNPSLRCPNEERAASPDPR